MRIVEDPEELEKVRRYMGLAAKVALNSSCKKSQRGAVIIKDGVKVGEGYNKPTIPTRCCLRVHIHDNSKTELCSAVHAEQLAIITTPSHLMHGATMYHAKVKGGVEVPAGPPSCTQCSKLVLESGIAEFVLWQKFPEGPRYVIYNIEEFNRLSFDYFQG